jgi:hypothetical protein
MEGAIENQVASVRALIDAGANLNIQDQVSRLFVSGAQKWNTAPSSIACPVVMWLTVVSYCLLSNTARVYSSHVGSGARARRHSAAAIECGGRQLSA